MLQYTDAHGEVAKQYRFDSFGNFLNQDTFALASSGGLFSRFDLRLRGTCSAIGWHLSLYAAMK